MPEPGIARLSPPKPVKPERQADRKPAAEPGRPTLFKGIAAFIGWLASSLAGLGAILYAIGYLITAAQLHLLGIGPLVTYSHEHYLQEGGNFFIAVGPEVLLIFLAFGATLIALSLLPAIAMYVAQRWTASRYRALAETITRFARQSLWFARLAAYGALLLVLLFVCLDPQSFGEPLTLSNLLFAVPEPATITPGAERVRALLLAGDRARLGGIFSLRLYYDLLVACLLAASWHLAAGWRFQTLAIAPFAVVFLLYTILLPMLYGVLKRPIQFPSVTLTTSGDAAARTVEPLFLLSKGEQEFVLYQPLARKVIWLPRDQVRGLDVTGFAPILGSRP